jgi:hypothetical protein
VDGYVILFGPTPNSEQSVRKCGNCYHWMKSSCKPENELNQVKSCNAYPCKDFDLYDDAKLIPKFTEELQEIEIKLAAL